MFVQFEDYDHQHKLLQFFCKHGEVTDERSPTKYLFDSGNVIVKGSTDIIKSLLIPFEGSFVITYENFTFYLKIKNHDSKSFINNANYMENSLGKSKNSIIHPKIFVFEISSEDVNGVTKLFEDIINDSIEIDKGDVLKIYFNKWNDSWYLHSSYEYQEITEQNLFLPEGILERVTSSIDKFIKNKERYTRFNIKHKLTFLLEGKPGMGKTSLTKLISNYYKRDLYILNLARKDMSDTDVIGLIRRIPPDVILLIEDLDSFFIGKSKEETSVCMSTMLNVLDGFMSSNEGLITFITANDAKVISQKLLRPGRIDRVINFGEITRYQFDAAWNVHVGNDSDNELFRVCQNGKLSMSSLIHILFYAETSEERLHLARQLLSERDFNNSDLNHMYS